MSQVAVYNENIYPFEQKFRGKLIKIPSKGHVLMDSDEANIFLGTMNTPVLDADGNHMPQGYKMLRIIKKNDIEEIEKASKPSFKCSACNQEYASQENLDDHIREKHIQMIVDKEFAEEFAEPKKAAKKK